jgi:hypothetical protein
MTKKELEYVKNILTKITPKDQHVEKAIAFVEKDIKIYEARKGQLRDNYEPPGYW